MENNIIDLFAEVPEETKKEGATGPTGGPGVVGKSSSLKSSAMAEAMNLMSNPKKLKGVAIALVLFLLIGIGSTIAFFIIYPICLVWAIGLCLVVTPIGRIMKFRIQDTGSRTGVQESRSQKVKE